MNNGKNITITDKLSTNQQFLSEDFQFIPENAKVSSSVSEDKKTATFVVNDNAAVTITYSTIITAENDNEEINNTVTALGKSEEVKKNVVVSHTSGGSGSRTQIILQKKEEGNNDVNLSGAVFELYKEDDTPVTYTTGYNSGKKVTVTTTSNRGTVTIGASGCGYDLYEGTSYYLKEITAPKGYSLSDKKWGFRIESDFTKVDITKGKYPMGDRDHIPTMTVTDKPLSVSGEARFSAEKVLNGAALKEGEFEFALKDSSGKTLSTAKNKADGSVAFDYEASYTQADVGKTYTYTINEVIPAADKQEADMEYDTTEYTVEVTPTDNGSGKLTCTPVYKKGDTETQTATFTNTKTTKGGAVLQITKALKGRMLKDSDRFEFELKDAAGTVLQTKTNVGGTVTFDEIPYSKEDVAKSPFIYTIHESSDKSAEGITNGKDVTATVTLTNKDNKVEAEVAYSNDAKITNTYSAKGEAKFSAEKVLNGAALKEGEFEFALKDSSGKTLSTAKNKADGSVAFDYEASYTQADVGKTYTYTINEVIPAADKQEADMEYDTTEYTVEVTPTDNGSGKLTCTPVYKKGDTETQTATFTNTKTTKGGAVLQITKALKGRMLKDSDRFEFELKDAAGTVLQTKTNVGGTVTFDEIPYSKEDVAKSPFIYTIHESSDKSAEGITNGKDVTAEVTLTNVNNVINASVEYTNGATITNMYRASGQVVLSARKVLKNRDLKESEFSFTLRDDGDETPAVNETVKNAAPGADKSAAVTFSPIKYEKAGTYKYTITEAVGNDGGVVYDSKISHVTVNVVDDGKGHLTATPEYDGSDAVPTFTNTATLVKVSKVDATNSKELAGATIQILDESGNVVAEWVSTTQAHEVVGLEAGKTYRLHETVAPDGYDLAEQDTTFSINKDGTVNAGTTKSVNGVLLVEDQAKKNALAFDKVSMFGMSMVGAKMAVIRLDAGGESVKDTWTTNGKAHQVEGISDGSYVLRELAAPNGFTLAPDVAFTVRDGKASLKQAGNGRLSTAGAVQVVVMTDAAQLGVRDQRFAKVDEQGKFLPGATLQIKTEEGNVIAEWTTDGSEHTERLIGGTYVLTETEAPSGYQVADPISFIVNEKGFIISIGGKAVSGSTDVVVTMTDKKIAAVTKPENEKKQEGKGVKTGDDTPILPMTMTLAISALAVLLILNKRKKETGEQ